MRVGGIVLCGGRSSRMGRPKAWLPVGGELMLPRVVRVLRAVVDPVVVVAAPGQDVPPLPREVAVVRDAIEGKGPLGGLAAGLAALDGRADAAYLSACDVPFLRPEFVGRVVGFLASGGRQPPEWDTESTDSTGSLGGLTPPARPVVAVPRVGDYFHPLAAAYRLSVRDDVLRLLAADRLRPVFLFDAVPTRVIEPHELEDVDPDFASLRNLNTPADYEAALRDLAAPPPG